MKSKAALAQAALSAALPSLDFPHIPLLGAGCLVWPAMAWICNTQSGAASVHVAQRWLQLGVLAPWYLGNGLVGSKGFKSLGKIRWDAAVRAQALRGGAVQEALGSAVHESDVPKLHLKMCLAEEQGKESAAQFVAEGLVLLLAGKRTLKNSIASDNFVCATKHLECSACNTSNCFHVFKT